MTTANITKIGGDRVEILMTVSPACLELALWNSEPTNFWNHFIPSKAFESHSK